MVLILLLTVYWLLGPRALDLLSVLVLTSISLIVAEVLLDEGETSMTICMVRVEHLALLPSKSVSLCRLLDESWR